MPCSAPAVRPLRGRCGGPGGACGSFVVTDALPWDPVISRRRVRRRGVGPPIGNRPGPRWVALFWQKRARLRRIGCGARGRWVGRVLSVRRLRGNWRCAVEARHRRSVRQDSSTMTPHRLVVLPCAPRVWIPQVFQAFRRDAAGSFPVGSRGIYQWFWSFKWLEVRALVAVGERPHRARPPRPRPGGE